jgi:hypothetical protein
LGGEKNRDFFGMFFGSHTDVAVYEHADGLEGAPLFTHCEIDGWRHVEVGDFDTRRSHPDSEQLLGMGVGQGLQQYTIDDAEDGAGGSER